MYAGREIERYGNIKLKKAVSYNRNDTAFASKTSF